MKNNNFIITKNDIYIAQVVSFIGVEETRLIYKDLNSDEIFRKALLKDKSGKLNLGRERFRTPMFLHIMV